jgi:glycosyltransferase involved in cell wall biosynthesis
MKIAVILPSLKETAPIQVAKDIIEVLNIYGCQVDIYYFKDIVDFKFINSAKKVSFFQRIDFNSYDIIHSHTFVPDLYILFNRLFIKTTCVSTLHNEIDKILIDRKGFFFSYIYTKIWVLGLKKFTKVVCLSNYAEHQIRRKFNFENTVKIYNGRSVSFENVKDNDFKKIIELKSKYVILGVIANISKIKGIEQIIDCLKTLDGFALIIIGDGEEVSNLKRRAHSLNLLERCFFLGHKTNAHRYMDLFDIYIMSSRSEGFPLVLIEAAQYSKPIVCSDLPMFREFFDNDEVEYFNIDDIESLRNSILRALNNREKLSSRIHLKYNEMYTSQIMGKNYFDLFESLVKVNS